MASAGLMVGKVKAPASDEILSLFEKVRVAYLSAKEDKKEYGGRWRNALEEIEEAFDSLSTLGKELKNFLDERHLNDDDAKDPESTTARIIYEAIKDMRFESDKVQDPFADRFKGDVLEALLSDIGMMVKFIHYAIRSDDKALSGKFYESKELQPDEITNGLDGLDLEVDDVPLYIIEHYGDDKDSRKVESQYKKAKAILDEMILSESSEEELEELEEVDLHKAEKSEKEKAVSQFIIPNKPMYRIFDIDDMKELKGFSGEYVVQEKYDGMRIQIHKIDNKVQIFSYNKKDITEKCSSQVKELQKKSYGDCILDAELILFDGDKALHRADTVAHVFQNKYKEARLRAHVFDIMRHEAQDLTDTPLRDRINILFNNYAVKSSSDLAFPSKKDTRIADSLKDIDDYAKEIMDMPTAEGVVIKDIESTYFIGTKKNPKWIKWKKFVDLDMLVLDKKSTKSGLYSYSLGAGPVADEDEGKHIVEYEGRRYMNVGKALNTKIKADVGQIIRVKVDEVREDNGRFTLYSAKVVEVPEVELPDKIVTLQMLSGDTKPSIKYKALSLKKGIGITDGIHGTAMIIAKSMDGFTIYGFQENNLMAKNALQDLDMWKQEAEQMMKTMQSNVRSAVIRYVKDATSRNKEVTVKELDEFLSRNYANEYSSLFENKQDFLKFLKGQKELSHFLDASEYITVRGNKVFVDESVLQKEEEPSKFKVYLRKDGNLNFSVRHKGENLMWTIDLQTDDDIFSLFGKAVKYPAEISEQQDTHDLLDEGDVTVGVQRHGYHEYILNGNKFETKLHFRVVEMDGEKTWIAWTGYEQDPVDPDTDEGVWNIYNDKFKSIKLDKNTDKVK